MKLLLEGRNTTVGLYSSQELHFLLLELKKSPQGSELQASSFICSFFVPHFVFPSLAVRGSLRAGSARSRALALLKVFCRFVQRFPSLVKMLTHGMARLSLVRGSLEGHEAQAGASVGRGNLHRPLLESRVGAALSSYSQGCQLPPQSTEMGISKGRVTASTSDA